VSGPSAKVVDRLLVGAAAVLVHGRSIVFGFTNLDDRDLIVDDHAFLSRSANLLGAFTRSYMHVVDARHPYYRPLVALSFALDSKWSGDGAVAYHLTNIALHAVASLLFLGLLRCFDLGRVVTRVAAMVFAVHPVLASAVAWIPGRNDSLLAVFALSSWLFFRRGALSSSRLYLALHLGALGLALSTKETAVVIPIVCAVDLALLDPEAWRRLRRSRRLFALLGGWAAVVLLRVIVRPDPADATVLDVIHNLPVLAAGLGQVVMPVSPSLFHVSDHLPLWPGLVASVLVAAALQLVPGVRRRVVVLGVAVFVLFLIPALALPGDLVLDTRLYMPACGIIIAVAEIVRALARDRAVLVAFSGVTVAALAALTTAYEETFRDRRAFARNAVASAPYSPLAHFCLGQSYQLDGDADRALAEYRMALALGASYAVHNNIAVIHMKSARWADAELELREELTVDPRYALAYRNLGKVLRREGRIDEALSAEQRASDLGFDPSTTR
jgi:tetratricopeptide (TPR) repeat protein